MKPPAHLVGSGGERSPIEQTSSCHPNLAPVVGVWHSAMMSPLYQGGGGGGGGGAYLTELLREVDFADLPTHSLGSHGLRFEWSKGHQNVL